MFNLATLAQIKAKLIERGKPADAVKVAIFATQEFPEHSDSWYHLGEAYLHNGNREQAAQSIRRSLALHPAHPDAIRLLQQVDSPD